MTLDAKVLTFDCYGTLIDWERGILNALTPLANRVGKSIDREGLLELFARIETEQELATPTKKYSDLLAAVYKRMAEHLDLPAPFGECEAFGSSVPSWPVFADSARSLRHLKKSCRLVILSNVDNRSFASSNAKLGIEFDAVFTAEDIGSYKPSPRNFEYMLKALAARGIEKSDILHVAQSLHHDIVPATAAGLTCCWIDRRAGKGGGGATAPVRDVPNIALRFSSMSDFVAAVRSEVPVE